MNPVLSRSTFFVKEHTGIFKAANNFDILDPENQQIIMECREPKLGFFTKLLRFTDYKRMTPFDIRITDTNGRAVVSVRRGISLLRSSVTVYNENDVVIGMLQQRLLSFGGKFEVQDASGKPLCMLKGSWSSWDFKFEQDGRELASVSKKWAGLGKELFTTADNYVLIINDTVAADSTLRPLILASVMCIDMVLKE